MRNLYSNRYSKTLQATNFPMSLSKAHGLLIICFLIANVGMAQGSLADGEAALQEAADGIAGYYDTVQNIIFIIAGIIALLGAIKTFMKWNMGDPDVMSSAAAWFGSAIFLIVAVTIIGTLFVG